MYTPEKHDLVVIGGGPAGLTAALTAEAHGIDTLVLDCSNLGGQAATATLIENYPGFPEGISGDRLIGNIVDQALKFTTEFQAPARVTDIQKDTEGILVVTDDNSRYLGKYALLSVGVEQSLLPARNLAAYTNRGVTYGSPNRNDNYENKKLIVVGGSDSAAQAAVHLSHFPGSEVHMILRSKGLEKRASHHLIEKISNQPNIQVHNESNLTAVDGNGQLEKAIIQNKAGETIEIPADQLFVLIGSVPKTSWLPEEIARDRQGYVLAGRSITEEAKANFVAETNGRQPHDHETTMPGLFVAGDVRSGSGKWVTLAVFDGASVIPEIQSLEVQQKLNHSQ